MSLNALVYRSQKNLGIDADAIGAIRNKDTGEYCFSTSEREMQFPPSLFIAREFWIGNISSVAELREEVNHLMQGHRSIVTEKCLYSGIHTGDVIKIDMLSDIEEEVRTLLTDRRDQMSPHLLSVLRGIMGLIEAAKREGNPIVFV